MPDDARGRRQASILGRAWSHAVRARNAPAAARTANTGGSGRAAAGTGKGSAAIWPERPRTCHDERAKPATGEVRACLAGQRAGPDPHRLTFGMVRGGRPYLNDSARSRCPVPPPRAPGRHISIAGNHPAPARSTGRPARAFRQPAMQGVVGGARPNSLTAERGAAGFPGTSLEPQRADRVGRVLLDGDARHPANKTLPPPEAMKDAQKRLQRASTRRNRRDLGCSTSRRRSSTPRSGFQRRDSRLTPRDALRMTAIAWMNLDPPPRTAPGHVAAVKRMCEGGHASGGHLAAAAPRGGAGCADAAAWCMTPRVKGRSMTADS